MLSGKSVVIKDERGFVKKREIKNHPSREKYKLLFLSTTVTTLYRAKDPYFC
jgi:hypothetical protein